ncbi:hypothetical protein DSM3645_02978 [Blastopirellula marina DSM 3645]|uniref:Uncharacterized protein n=1 Tax=Blastopirellula marina DSM 3645 TaxID=314230 RepID=A3ZVQ9_9BACT|nr:hypothetical protein DSM3645_02978 [Blastopirellula marina DSM 3645]
MVRSPWGCDAFLENKCFCRLLPMLHHEPIAVAHR